MEAEIDTWKSFYPTLQGIFFDEQSNSTGDVAHYQTLSQYAKSVGLSYTVGNPGTGVPTAYVGAVDTMLIYESDGVPPMSDLSAYSAYAKSNFGVIPYAVSGMNSTFVQQARQYVAVHLPDQRRPAEPLGQPVVVLLVAAGGAGVDRNRSSGNVRRRAPGRKTSAPVSFFGPPARREVTQALTGVTRPCQFAPSPLGGPT